MPLLVCPNDNASMQSVQRHGVEFDFCPTCRGVWLDRGELEKLMAGPREGDAYDAPPRRDPPRRDERDYRAYEERRDRDTDDRRRDDDYRPRKRRGFDLFDIFD